MGLVTLFDILSDIVLNLSMASPGCRPLPNVYEPETLIADLGLDLDSLPGILAELKSRLDGKDVNILSTLGPDELRTFTLKQFLRALQGSILTAVHSPIVVYVDDEEENLFIFKRRFGKDLRLETFTDPELAFAFIRSEPSVRLVLTDEVMPGLTGTALCNAVRRYKPFLKFILVTGNPDIDQDLLYNSLRHGKFHDFISKPLDLENKGAEYLAMIRALTDGEPGS